MKHNTFLKRSYGHSTGHPPIQESRRRAAIQTKKILFNRGRFLEEFFNGKITKTTIAINIATTPPNFLGIARKIAYAHKKYHSGLIWAGVERGLAERKFSGSLKIIGKNKTTEQNIIIIIKNLSKSL